jgi:hypothetical protein
VEEQASHCQLFKIRSILIDNKLFVFLRRSKHLPNLWQCPNLLSSPSIPNRLVPKVLLTSHLVLTSVNEPSYFDDIPDPNLNG